VRCLFTRASAIKKDFVAYVARSMARIVGLFGPFDLYDSVMPLTSQLPGIHLSQDGVKLSSRFCRLWMEQDWRKDLYVNVKRRFRPFNQWIPMCLLKFNQWRWVVVVKTIELWSD
jgi:hypothetical protein